MDCSFFPPLLMSTLNMHEADIKALLCRCCESLSTDDKGRWFSRFIELQRRQNSMIPPELLHRDSSGFLHSLSMSPAALHIPGKAQWISLLQGCLDPQGPARRRRGSHSNSVQPFESSILPSSSLAASQREPEQPGPGSSARGPEILHLPEAGFGLRG